MISGCFVPNRYVDMPVRRHIQDEGSPRLLAGLMKEASMSFVGSIQSIDRSLHSDTVPQGKKKIKEKVNCIFILISDLQVGSVIFISFQTGL